VRPRVEWPGPGRACETREAGIRRRFFLLACGFLATAAGLGQTTGGIQGGVVASSNVPLPGGALQGAGATLPGHRAPRPGKDGTYRLPGLPPGPYKLAASLPGFASVEKTVDVLLDATTSVKLILQLSLSEQVVVTATEASGEALVDTSSTTTGTTYRCGVIV